MAYLVLARKYRPQSFEDVVGQEHVTRTLQNAIQGERVAHGYLFAGARGVGKTSAARILAKALNCKEGMTPQPCGKCVSCEEIVTGQSMDVFEVDGASNRGIDQIRELRETVRFRPSRDRCKIYIIDEVHMLTSEAFNALLKTLEEPPDHVHFIFATTEPQKIPLTILSRCQRFDFKRLSSSALVGHLGSILSSEGMEASEQALQILAREADGSVRDSLSLLDRVIAYGQGKIDPDMVREALGVSDRGAVFSVVEALVEGRAGDALLSIDKLVEHGLDLQHFSRQLVQLLRDLLVVRVAGVKAAPVDMSSSQLEELSRLADQASLDALQWMVHRSVARLEEIAHSSTPRISLELAVVELSRLSSLVGLEHFVRRLEAIERGAVPPAQRTQQEIEPPRETPPVVPEPPPAVSAPPPVEQAPPSPAQEAGPPRVEAQAPTAEAPPEAPPHAVVEASPDPAPEIASEPPKSDLGQEAPDAPDQGESTPDAQEQAERAQADEEAQATLLRGDLSTPSKPPLTADGWSSLLDKMVGLGGKIGTAATLARRYIFDAHDGGTLRLIARLDDTDSIQRFLRDHKDALCAAIEGTLDISGVQLELRAAEVPKGAMSPSERARAARASEEAKRRNTLGQHPVVQEFVRNLGAKIVLMNTDISVLAPPEPQLEL